MEPHRSLNTPFKKTINRLRLILGDQLSTQHSWFKEKDPNTIYLIAELKQELEYTTHHVQKICAFFSAMAQFASRLSGQGHEVLYLTLDETAEFNTLNDLLFTVIKTLEIRHFDYQRPDEYRLVEALSQFSVPGVVIGCHESEHFLLDFNDIKREFKADKTYKMEFFYRKMRKHYNILIDSGQPKGGQWNYDAENRAKLKPEDLATIPEPKLFSNPVSDILLRLNTHAVKTMGQSENCLIWPVNREQSLELLEYFCAHLLRRFGTFQDAMTEKSKFKWSLYHSRISFALNSKMIKPLEVIEFALKYADRSDITLPQIEGFVRQILGWREFIRGIYWANMPGYSKKNYLGAQRKLPDFFWNANTKMNCLKQAIAQSLDYSYAHHIQRLMITGNFCLLAGIQPDEVDQWYLGIYVDAIEWVEMPNTRGMAQFADHGILATKPYAASGSYINKMSDYCKNCSYSVKNKTEQDACPFNSLYWNFIHQHGEKFSSNPRMKMIYQSWMKMDSQKQSALLTRASEYLQDIEKL